MNQKRAVIIGAGPAGLTAAYEFVTRTGIIPIVLEASEAMGGISRTIQYKGNRIDIGGHRFFSKSDRVMNWWLQIMPLQTTPGAQSISYQQKTRTIEGSADGPNPETTDTVMLVRKRKSRIYFLRQFFDYPIKLSGDTITKLGAAKVARIGASYMWSVLFPIKNEQNLEQFFINRFGRELYLTFFKSYTEKVWGVPCNEISAAWGAQRIKGLSITKTLQHLFKQFTKKKAKTTDSPNDLAQKDVETSLIEQFMYPKHGPGQMWEEVAGKIQARGGQILTGWYVNRILTQGDRVTAVEAQNRVTGDKQTFEGEYFFSTMPIRELINALDVKVSPEIQKISDGLVYRDFITVGLLLNKLKIKEPDGSPVQDNWIYIQEPDVQVGRLQIFNNWSPYLVADPSKVWVGLEYFCYDTDPIWHLTDEKMIELAKHELEKIGIIDSSDVTDATVIRVPKTYPAYFGTYDQFDRIQEHVDVYRNLFLVGRNGMHKYNNQDHSMLTAMMSVDNIIEGREDKKNIWDVNTEVDYHETKKDEAKVEEAVPIAS
jgi:protoporphyrinogen oxidase